MFQTQQLGRFEKRVREIKGKVDNNSLGTSVMIANQEKRRMESVMSTEMKYPQAFFENIYFQMLIVLES
jgi:hypothetical protein